MFVLKDGRDQGKERPPEFTDSEAFFAKGSRGENAAAAACSAQGTHCQLYERPGAEIDKTLELIRKRTHR